MTIEYQKGDSNMHRLDPRTKLLMAISFTFIPLVIQDPILSAVVFFLLRRLGIVSVGREVVDKNLRQVVPVFLMFGLFNVIFRPAPDGVFLFYLLFFVDKVPIILESVIAGTGLFFRFITIVLAVHLLLYTTPSADMVLGMTKQGSRSAGYMLGITALLTGLIFAIINLAMPTAIGNLPFGLAVNQALVAGISLLLGAVTYYLGSRGIPAEIAMGLSIGFATLGLLTQQTQKITDAQAARGYDTQPKNIIARIRVIVTLVLPIFFATIQRAQDIAVAIQARAFDYNIRARTYRRALVFHRADYLFMTSIVSLLMGGLVLSYFGANNATEQLVKSIFNL